MNEILLGTCLLGIFHLIETCVFVRGYVNAPKTIECTVLCKCYRLLLWISILHPSLCASDVLCGSSRLVSCQRPITAVYIHFMGSLKSVYNYNMA